MRVTYVPEHANGNASHPDCERIAQPSMERQIAAAVGRMLAKKKERE